MKRYPVAAAMWLPMVASVVFLVSALSPREAWSSCASPANAIEAENCLPGTPDTTWDISGAGDGSIQGFATDISVNIGETVHFKIDTNANNYTIDIYRMGYYGGMGARKIATISPSVSLPQNQPNCLTQSGTGLIDCGNWAESASWTVPVSATSGIYFALLTRTDTGGQSHIVFIVRDDLSHSNILFQASDATWQAYNDYGGNNFYTGNGSVGRAYKVSFNRPFHTRIYEAESWVFNAEYPMVRWLEANGYDVTYFTDTDTDRHGALLLNHKVWMSNGHDEYWSGNQRANVEAARAAGVHLAFFSSNTMFWKTRWENSIDGSGTPYRTLVCYKETHANAVIDPADPPTWTGTWRDPRFSPPADGGRPENALIGSLFKINGPYDDAITVPQADGRMRFWRNTSIASLPSGQTATLAPGTLGAEVDVDLDNGFRPAGLFGLSTNNITTTSQFLVDYGSSYGAGTAAHKLTLYRYASGSLVFASGTYQWSWGLDSNHDRSSLGSSTDVRMKQATVNLFADMGVQPTTLETGLTIATASTDLVAPTSVITSPSAGANVSASSTVTITGTAVDTGGGGIAGVEVSTDGGITWHPATGRGTWTYNWQPTVTGSVTIKSRAVDDSGNLETPSAGITVTVGGTASCTTNCTIWSGATVPSLVDGGPDSSVELGVKFRSDVSGSITGIRFYKASTNTGTHIGNLWTSTGTLLASATFTNETASGWQQVLFSSPVSITANTVYVASYHANNGHYSDNVNYFASTGMDSPPLHALANGISGGNGVYAYGSTSSFPTLTWSTSNYWVDLVFTPTPTGPPTLVSITLSPANPTISPGSNLQFSATGHYSDNSTQDLTSQLTWSSSNTSVATVSSTGLASALANGTATISAKVKDSTITGSTTLTVQTIPLSITTNTLPAGDLNIPYSATLVASGGTTPYAWSITSGSLPTGLSLNGTTGVISGPPTATGTFSFTAQVSDSSSHTATRALNIAIVLPDYTIWPNSTVPGLVDGGADSPVELGVKFRSDVNGFIAGIRFYKATTNTGTHVGNLWTSTGTRLATATFTGETSSGWQQVIFSSPVPITANTVYVASYHVNTGHYSADVNYFTGKGMDSPPLHALQNGVSGGDGVYAYGSTSSFPNLTWNSANYWVDVVFSPAPTASLTSITVTPGIPTIVVGGTQAFTATGNYSDGSTLNLTNQVTWGSSSTNVATITTAGMATGVGAGSTTISAGLSGITGSTTLTVQAAPLSITTTTLPGGTQSVAYSASLAATGGTTPYTWTVASGSLPTNLFLNSNTGAISGTPSAAGTFNFTVRVTDTGNPVQTTTKPMSIVISATLTSITVTPVNPTIVAGGTQAFTATGNYSDGSTQNLTSLSTWGSSSTNVATITTAGVATGVSTGSTTISAKVGSITGSTTLTVQPAPLTITTGSLPGGVLNVSYSATLSASGGTTPYTWAITSGSLPAGLTLNNGTGMISGLPTASGTFNFTARVTDASSATATKNLSIDIGISPPMLIISSASNPFTTYYAEILRAEGFNEFDVKDLSAVSGATLSSYDVVLLGEMSLSAAQVTMFSDYVTNAGGHLIAMRPDKQLAGLLGLTNLSATRSNGYLLVNTSSGPGVGIVNQTIQYHGTADRYSLNGAVSLATLYSNATTATSDPAATLRNVGSNGGQVAAFTYDLAKSIVYTRQGNPAWAGQERDGVSPIRSDDLFYGAASFDPQPDWVDLDKVAIPQADEQQRLLANLIIEMNYSKKPLPRFWYLPRGLAAVVVMTGDDHAIGGTAGRFDNYIAMSPPGCSVDDWECIRSTSYVYTDSPLSDAEALSYVNAGFEVGVHINTRCADYTPTSLEDDFASEIADWIANYPSLPSPVTNRTHCVPWSDYSTQPMVELAHGIRLDATYYYWPPDWLNNRPGFFTGSGIPMRFATANGTLIDVYQAATQLTDESGQSYPFTIDSLLDKALGPEGYYGVFTANMHTDNVESSDSDAVVASAQARGVPIVSAKQMLTWLDGRNGSAFTSVSWSGNTLSFSIAVAQGTNGLEVMVPVPSGESVSSVTLNGTPLPFSVGTVKGVQYVFLVAYDGSYQVTYNIDTTPPTVTSVSPANGSSNVSTLTNISATFSEAVDPATISTSTLALKDPSNGVISAAISYDTGTQTATLTPNSPLAGSTTYTATAKGGSSGVKDTAGNPLTTDFNWSFTTAAATTYSIWNSTTIPGIIDSGPDSAVELGVKFRSDVNGSIIGVRFYKASTNTGTHVANLWSATGARLATATFTNETASGWQQVLFSSPVAITANTVYIVSYHTNTGHYSDNQNFFAGSGVDSPPLHALANGVSGGNGVYAYGSTSNLPNLTWNTSNYWVDVIFQP